MFKSERRQLPSILAIVFLATLTFLSLHVVAAQVATGDFSIALSKTNIAIPQGSSGTVNLYVASLNGFSQTVSLSYSGPSGVAATFNGNGPSQIATAAGVTSASTVTIILDDTVSTGTFPFIIIGSSPTGLTHRAALSVTVTPAGTAPTILSSPLPDFLSQPSPATITLTPDLSKSTSIVYSSVNGFSSTLTLSAAWTGVAPNGISVSLPSPVTVPAGGSASSTLTLTADGSPSTGTYTLVVTGTNGVISHSSDVVVSIYGTLSVLAPVAPDFSITSAIIQPSPATITLAPDTSQSANIVLTSVDGFSSSVTLSIGWNGAAPNDLSVTPPSPTTVTVPGSGSVSSALTFTAGSAPSFGSYTLLVTATNGVTSHSTEIPVIVSGSPAVLAPVSPVAAPTIDFSLHPSTDTVSTIPGLSAGTSVIVISQGSFSAPVTFSVSWVGNAPVDVGVNIPQTVTPPAGGEASSPISFTTSALTPSGVYIAQVTATSGSITHSTDVTLQLNSPSPF